MDFKFTQDEEAFRKELVGWIKRELPPGYEGGEDLMGDDAGWQFSLQMRKKLAQKGWLTLAWPKEYGGLAASHMTQMIFSEEMTYHRCPGPDGFGVGMLGPTLMIHGSDEQKRQFLPRISSAETVWCEGYSEPGSGSDLASLQTKAVEDGDDFVINGSKIWTSGAHRADWIFMLTRTDPNAEKHRGISFLLVDMKTPGLTVRPVINMAGIHSFNQVFFDNVRTPKRYLVGEKNRGWYVAMTLLDFERSGVGYAAGAQRTLEELVQYAKDTKVDGQPLSQKPLIRNRMAEMAIETRVSRMLSYTIAWMQSKAKVPNKEASIGKLFGTELQQRLASTGMQLLGLYGQLSKGSKWAPLQGRIKTMYLSTVSATIAAGTSEIQRGIIAGRGLGLPR